MNIASKYKIESLSEDQFDDIFDIYKKFFPPFGWSAKYLHWHYYENPCGKAKMWVAKENGKIVASYTAIPHRVFANGQVATGWRIQNVVTLPDHRGLGLYHRLAKIAAHELFKGEYPLNFAFPNERSKNGFIRTGWKAAFRLPLKTKSLRELPTKAYTSAVVKPLTRFDTDSERIWEAHRNSLSFSIDRSTSYLNWRYFDNPKSKYFSFRLDIGKAQAILILKIYVHENGERYSHLCDFFQSEPNSALSESAFKHWIDFSIEWSCSEMNCWCATGSSMDTILSKAGFKEKNGFDRWMLINANLLALKKATTNRYDLLSSWHLVMGDSDVY